MCAMLVTGLAPSGAFRVVWPLPQDLAVCRLSAHMSIVSAQITDQSMFRAGACGAGADGLPPHAHDS